MADFTQAATVPTSTQVTVLEATLTAGSNNTGFGLSPKYVYASEFTFTFNQEATLAARVELKLYPPTAYYGRPLDGRLVPFQLPDPWSLEVIGQPPLGAPVPAPGGSGGGSFNDFDIWYF